MIIELCLVRFDGLYFLFSYPVDILGLDRFAKEIKVMVGRTPGIVWKIMWYLVTPGVILVRF